MAKGENTAFYKLAMETKRSLERMGLMGRKEAFFFSIQKIFCQNKFLTALLFPEVQEGNQVLEVGSGTGRFC